VGCWTYGWPTQKRYTDQDAVWGIIRGDPKISSKRVQIPPGESSFMGFRLDSDDHPGERKGDYNHKRGVQRRCGLLPNYSGNLSSLLFFVLVETEKKS